MHRLFQADAAHGVSCHVVDCCCVLRLDNVLQRFCPAVILQDAIAWIAFRCTMCKARNARRVLQQMTRGDARFKTLRDDELHTGYRNKTTCFINKPQTKIPILYIYRKTYGVLRVRSYARHLDHWLRTGMAASRWREMWKIRCKLKGANAHSNETT